MHYMTLLFVSYPFKLRKYLYFNPSYLTRFYRTKGNDRHYWDSVRDGGKFKGKNKIISVLVKQNKLSFDDHSSFTFFFFQQFEI